jgi:hypothetical protein
MTKKWMMAMVGAAAMALSTGAFAQMTPSFYAGVELGHSDVGNESDIATRVFGGFRFHPNIAAEVGYGFLYDKGATEITALEVAGIGMYEVAPQITLLGKLGFANIEVDAGGFSDDSTELLFGIGAQYDVTRNLGARLMLTRYTADGDDVTVIGISALWRF